MNVSPIFFTKQDLELTAQQIVDDIKQLETQSKKDELNINTVEKIKQAAQRYILVLDTATPKIQQFENILKQIKKIYQQLPQAKIAQKEIQKYERSKNLFLSSKLGNIILSETDKFQHSLFEVLGTKLKTIYTFEGQIYDISDVPAEQLFKSVYSSRRKFQGAYNTSAIKTLANTNLLPTIDFDKQVEPVYQEVLKRYKYTKQIGIFWQTQQRHFQKVQSQGSIEEAFAYFGIAKQNSFQNIINKEEKIEIFVEEGVKQVDNISGRLQGDFRVGQIEFAAKSLGASMASLQQFKKLANLIVSQAFSDISQLKDIREDDARRGRKINAVSTEITEELNDLIEQYLKF